MTLTAVGSNTFAGDNHETVITLPITDSTTITATDFVELSSGKLIKSVTTLSSSLVGIAKTTKTMGVLATVGTQEKVGVITEGLIKLKGLVEGSGGTYKTALAIGSKVSFHYDATSGYGQFVVNSDASAVGTVIEGAVASSGSTTDQWDYVTVQLDFETAGGGANAIIPSVITGTKTFSSAITVNVGGSTIGAFGDGTGAPLTAVLNDAFQIYPELPSSGTALAGGTVVYGIRNRFLVNKAQTANVSLYGTQGQLRVKANLAAGVHAGLYGYFEQSGTVTLSSSGSFNAACNLGVEGASTLTVASGVNLVGCIITSVVHASATINGNFYGLMIRKATSQKDWAQGINIANSVIGVDVGACTTGINFSGACTSAAISMDSATFANGDHEIQMRNTVSGDKTIIAAGTATNDSGIVTAVGADADIADGSLYLSATDGGGVLFVKVNDTWTALTTT